MLLSWAKQIHQPITSVGFAAGGSVLDHRFGKGDAYTLGIEEEYVLLDADSFDPRPACRGDRGGHERHELQHRVTRELIQSVLEIATPVCRSAPDVERELRTLRGYVAETAAQRGLGIAASR
jgi:carboxylate-amine ligase